MTDRTPDHIMDIGASNDTADHAELRARQAEASMMWMSSGTQYEGEYGDLCRQKAAVYTAVAQLNRQLVEQLRHLDTIEAKTEAFFERERNS
jgi:hypothetical protein